MGIQLHVPLGTVVVSGNPCPQDGIYISKNGSRRYICRRGRAMPKVQGKDKLLRLDSYLC